MPRYAGTNLTENDLAVLNRVYCGDRGPAVIAANLNLTEEKVQEIIRRMEVVFGTGIRAAAARAKELRYITG